MYNRENAHDNAACIALFKDVLPERLEDVLEEFAPNGWQQSPFYNIKHPTPEQRYQEALEWYDREPLFFEKETKQDEAPPQLEDFPDDGNEEEVDPLEEMRHILGTCLWDVFSDNHEVIGPEGKAYDIGSFRGSGGFIAQFLNVQYPLERSYDYLDFYMGSGWVLQDRADLTPLYEWIFRRLKANECDWRYAFPRLMAIDVGGKNEEADSSAEDYDPSEAMANELAAKEREEEGRKLRQSLDDIYSKTVEDAKYKPPPATVQAYKSIYEKWPEGWPPWE